MESKPVEHGGVVARRQATGDEISGGFPCDGRVHDYAPALIRGANVEVISVGLRPPEKFRQNDLKRFATTFFVYHLSIHVPPSQHHTEGTHFLPTAQEHISFSSTENST